MLKEWLGPISFAAGLLAAVAWCLVFVVLVFFHYQPAKHVHWDRVAIGAAIAFLVGWGLMRFAARQPTERRKEEDDLW